MEAFMTAKIQYLYKTARISTRPGEVEFKRGKQLSLSHDLCRGVFFWLLQLHQRRF